MASIQQILGIETSCDETAAAVVEGGTTVLSSVIASSRESFADSGGVIPEEAARKQVECVPSVIRMALEKAGTKPSDLDAIAVTYGPGLLGSLLVGTTAARSLAMLWNLPLIGVHHTFGHLSSPWLEQAEPPTFPCITLSASGGHTDLWFRSSHTKGTLLSRTRDDAAGEAFDKGAALLGLPYPGGPAIAAAAEGGDASAFVFTEPLRGEDTLDFSFSGLKTALKYTIRDLDRPLESVRNDLAASYQVALCRHLVTRVAQAAAIHSTAEAIHLVGGVSANKILRQMVQEQCDLPVITPSTIKYCTDNAAMIAAAGFFLWEECGSDAFVEFQTTASAPLSTMLHA